MRHIFDLWMYRKGFSILLFYQFSFVAVFFSFILFYFFIFYVVVFYFEELLFLGVWRFTVMFIVFVRFVVWRIAATMGTLRVRNGIGRRLRERLVRHASDPRSIPTTGDHSILDKHAVWRLHHSDLAENWPWHRWSWYTVVCRTVAAYHNSLRTKT